MIKDYNVNIPPHLSDVLADLSGLSTDAEFDTLITAGRPLLFNFDYPVSTADKQALEEFILNYYITRRIGSGNVKKWRQYLKAKMLEIMPYYKQLLDSEKISFEPIMNNDLTTTDNGGGTLDETRDGRRDDDETHARNLTELNRYLDTPQGNSSRVWERDAQGNLNLSDYYITDVRGITDSENGSSNRDIVDHETRDQDTTHENTNVKQGVSGSSKSNLLNEYRETFLRIYGMIAEELQPLFYNLVEIDDILDYV